MRLALIASLLFIQLSLGAIENEQDAKGLRRLLEPSYRPINRSPETSANTAKIELGRKLYFDTRLSVDQTTSCNSCHDLQAYGTNGKQLKRAIDSAALERDVPSIYNIGSLELFDWDGASTALKQKISDAIRSETEMNRVQTSELIKDLSAVTAYQALFSEVYNESSEPITFVNLVDALEAFISGLITEAPIDHFMAGDDSALTVEQIKGGHLFTEHACYACHTGTNFGGQMLQKVGILRPWPNQKDLGYYELTGDKAYEMFFRVSPLRNVNKTAPYFHDRSSRNIRDAIQRMGLYERGHFLNIEDSIFIEAFLASLTGELPMEYIKQPELAH